MNSPVQGGKQSKMLASRWEERKVKDVDISAPLIALPFGPPGTPFTAPFYVNDIPCSGTVCNPAGLH